MKIFSLVFLLFSLVNVSIAEDDHKGHDHSKDKKESHKGHDHSKEKKEDHKGHDHEEDEDHDGHDHSKQGKDSHDNHDGHYDHGHGGGKAMGKGKAIVEVDEKKGFKLSKEAIKTLKLKLNTVDGSKFSIAKKTLVASKDKKGVYRFRGGFFKLLPVKILKEENGTYQVEVKGVDFGDQIVVDGLGLLRVTDVYSTDKSEYGHSH
jgi:hypothetical protein